MGSSINGIILSIIFGDVYISNDLTWKDLNIEDSPTLYVTLTPEFLECENELLERLKLEEEMRLERLKQEEEVRIERLKRKEKERIEREKRNREIMQEERKRIQ